jgi:triacylglycerol esterase/lipase EstA (alpha/beta hydrolase family)
MRILVRAAVAAGLVVAALSGPGRAGAASDSGPPLDVPPAALAAALQCHGDLGTGPTPVLLVPGTTLTAEVNYSWNYEPAFTRAGRSWCAVTVPNHGMSDVQVAGEYLVYALRAMHAQAGRKISVLGYSQGGMSPRWALKWWPDTRAMVDDVVSIDPSNHGTLDTFALCAAGCAPSFWQQTAGSNFLTALNAGQETYAGISYTEIYSMMDEVVVPNVGARASSALRTGPGEIRNVAVQSVCPAHVAEHLTMGTVDPVGYALVLDALDHAGPADPARVRKSVCRQLFLPGISPAAAAKHLTRLGLVVGQQIGLYPHVPAEPPLAGYAEG